MAAPIAPATSLTDQRALAPLARLAAQLLRAHGAMITVLQDDQLVVLSAAGSAFAAGAPGPMPAADTPCAAVARSGQPAFHDDLSSHEAWHSLPATLAFGIKAYASVPLVADGGRAVGTLCVFDCAPRGWTVEDRARLGDLAAIAAAEFERLSAVTALSTNNFLLVSVIEGTTDLIFVKDLEGRYLLVNSALAEAVGLPAKGIVGHGDENLFPADVAAGIRSEDAEVISREAAVSLEQAYWLKGQWRQFLTVKGPYRDNAGRTIGVFGIAKDVTDRRRAEEALRRSDELHRLVVTVTREAIWDEDFRAGTILRGEGYRTIFGYPEDQIPTDNQWWIERIHPEDRERVAQYYAALYASRVQDSESEYRWQRADGSYAVVLDVVRVVRDEHGAPIRLLGALQDVTERVEARREVARSFSLLEATLESTADGLLVVGREGEIRSYNSRFAELWRIPAEVLRAGRDADAIQWALASLEDSEAFLAQVRRLYAEPESESIDTLRLKDGRIFERYSRPQRIGTAIVGRVWSFRDVTAQRQAEERLEASRTRYQLLVDTIDGIVWEGELDATEVTFVSRQAERLLGYPVAAWREPGFWPAHVHPEDRARAMGVSLAESRAGRNHTTEYRMLAADGRVVWFRDYVSVEVMAGGRTVQRGVMVDISEQKHTEEALRQREDQLRQAQKMEAVGRLAGGIAHDFNNLLTAIVGYSDLLRDSLSGDARTSEVLEIRRAADRATQLTRQLLAFSRKQVLQPADLDLNDIVLGLASLLQRIIGEPIRLETGLASLPTWIRADRGQLEQVIINLAVNARDAMPNGGVLTIGVWSGETGPTPTPAQLVIHDTGIGMDEATRAHIFEPFFTTKPVGQGTGLGLATVYGIVKQSGGDIRVESMPGAGTTFRISLPTVAEPSGPQGAGAAAPGPVRGGGESVLLVEDDGSVRRLAASVLRGLGYTVTEAPSGEAALAIAREGVGPVHLVLTDIVMPGMSGVETRTALIPLLPASRFLFMSGYPLAELARTGIQLRARELLQKPFTPDELARRVREMLDIPAGRQTPTPK